MQRIARLLAALALGLLATLPAATALAAASISASPAQVPFGQFATTITFSTGGAAGTVCVAANGAAESPFAGGAAGSQQAAFIQSGRYLFTLHAGADCTGAALAAITVQKLTPALTAAPGIAVTPPSFAVKAGTLADTATVNWDVGDGSVGSVAVAVNGGTPILVAQATYGSVQVPWVQSGAYAFTLHYGGGLTQTATTTALAGIAPSPTAATAPASLTVTANSGNGGPVVICLQAGSGASTPFSLGNSGIANGTIGGLGKAAYVFTAFAPADGKTPLTSVATGVNGAQCTANTPLVTVKNPDNSLAQVIVVIT